MGRQKNVTVSALVPSRSTRAKVRRFVVDHGLLRAGDAVLVGVSGGPDSTCLLLLLAALRSSLKISLHVAYFDHGLRGPRAASREERYVRALAETLEVPFQRGIGDVRGYAREARRSIEEAARELRYRFLAETAHEAGCDVVAVGHTRDDQAETVMLHLVRGSGLRGLAGMAPASSWPVGGGSELPRLVRPLLCLSRADTERCCHDAGLVPQQDPSNRSRSHLRNRIRGELLPLMRRYNPKVDDALVRLAGAAADDVGLLEALAAEALVSEQSRSGGSSVASVGLVRRRLGALPPALQRHAVRLAVRRLVGDLRGLSDRHVRAVLRASEGRTGAQLDLPRGLRVEVKRSTTVISNAPPAVPSPLPERGTALPVPGSARFGTWRLQAELLRKRPRDLSRTCDGEVAFLDADACGGALRLRRRRPGDRFQPLGLSRPKKLQDFFVDAHVPRAKRDAVPIVCSRRGIVWIVGQRPAEWAKVTPATRRVLRLRATRTRA